MALPTNRTITVWILILFNVSIMASLRNLPLVAEFGLSMVFFFAMTALFFLLPCALVSAELATGWPKDGGIYIWVREALGDRWGFFAIWMQWVHNVAWYPAILSFVASTIAFVFDPALGDNPYFIISTVLILFWGMTYLNYFGIETSTLFSSIGVVVGTILPGIFIISLGVLWFTSGNPIQFEVSYDALIPSGKALENLTFLAGLFLAFAGLEVSASVAGSVKNPQRNYPLAIIGAAAITFFLFMLGALSVAAVIPQEEISLVTGVMNSLEVLLNDFGLLPLLPVIALLLVIGAVAEVNSWLMGPVKALYTTAEHGNLPPLFQKLNKHGMPTNLLIFQALIVTVAALVILLLPDLSASYWILSALSAQIYLIMYIVMFISAIVLRYTHPNVPRLYRIPSPHKGIWIVSIIGIASCLFAIGIAFIPPAIFDTGSTFNYELIMVGSLIVLSSIPFIVHAMRKPSWVRINDDESTTL